MVLPPPIPTPPPPRRPEVIKPMVIFDEENSMDAAIVDFGPKQRNPKEVLHPLVNDSGVVQTLEDFTEQDRMEAQATLPLMN